MSIKKCKIKGCNGKHYGRGYCKIHYLRWYYHGYVPKRSKTDPNEFIFRDDVCLIKMFNNSGEETGMASIDKEDYNKVKDRKWYLRAGSRGVKYVVSGHKDNFIRLHNLILQHHPGKIVDHKDRNTLNNRKNNLRPCTNASNSQNSKTPITNISGAKNVCWRKDVRKWAVGITANKERIHIGFFADIEEATQAAIKARKKYHGNFACA